MIVVVITIIVIDVVLELFLTLMSMMVVVLLLSLSASALLSSSSLLLCLCVSRLYFGLRSELNLLINAKDRKLQHIYVEVQGLLSFIVFVWDEFADVAFFAADVVWDEFADVALSCRCFGLR